MEKKTKTVLFVCTGNTCRSSMAEVLAKDYLHRRKTEETSPGIEKESLAGREDGEEIQIVSAGISAFLDTPASPQAREVMLELGLDLSSHRAGFLTAELLERADLILTMTRGQQEYIEEMLSAAHNNEAYGKVYLLKEYALGEESPKTKEELGKPDILDPFGQSVEVYRACAEELSRYIPQALERFAKEKTGQG
ncbi:MAG: low molecular weight protein arginine phosphatase [Clostridia bacterium]|jgi:protein-tyrosine-phosphatase|nr:low molecular weight protein arginine phosphatase [Clostridia bacterium]